MKHRAPWVALLVALGGCADRASVPLDLATKIQKLDLGAYQSSRYEFLKPQLAARSLVGLGESVRMTQELPHAQLAFVKFIHEELGFDVIAFEGSLVDAWIASDYSYSFNDPLETKIQHAQQLAWFDAWQTPAMREVMAYVISTQATAHPLYLAGFGVQAGASHSLSSENALFTSLAGALRAYVAAPEATLEDEMKLVLGRLTDCDATGFPTSDAERDAALETLGHIQSWTAAVLPAMRAQHRPANHAAALSLLPSALRKRVAQCDANRHPGEAAKAGSTEDRLAGQEVFDLLSVVSSGKKVILWADHGTLHYNSLGENSHSMGEYLHQQIPDRLYTIGFFAGHGRYTSLIHRGPVVAAERNLTSLGSFGVESTLAGLRLPHVFVELSKLDPRDIKLSDWFVASTSRLEGGSQQTSLAHDFDGAVYVDQAHAAWPIFVPDASKRTAVIAGFVLDHGALIAGAPLLVLVAVAGVRVMRRRRRTPPQVKPAPAAPAAPPPVAPTPVEEAPPGGNEGGEAQP